MLKGELRTIERTGLQKPNLREIELADLRIWIEVPRAVFLSPKADEDKAAEGPGSWQTSGEEVYFQRRVL
jgi:hypothetical protein